MTSRGSVGLVLALFLSAIPPTLATQATLAPGETVLSWKDVYIGTDTTVTPPDFTYGYLGTNEGIQSCFDRADDPINIPVCRHDIPPGVSETWIDLRQQPIIDPDARAGVGLAYRFVPGCTGQNVPPTKPVTLTAWYDRTVTVTNTGGLSFAEIWAHPTEGRGDVQTAENPPEAGGTNERLELFHASSPKTTKMYQETFGTVAGEHKAIVYSRAHAQRASLVQSAIVESKVDLKLHNVSFDWTDTTVPSISISYTQPDGSALTPIAGARGGHWFRDGFKAVYRASDDFSCVKQLKLRNDIAHPWAEFDIDRDQDPVVILYGGGDNSWTSQTQATDHQGNTGGRNFLMGVDTTPPEVSAYVARWTLEGRAGWYRANVDVAFSCIDLTAGCWKVRSWINNASEAIHTSFPAERPLTVDGRYWLTCVGEDNTYLTTPCAPRFVGLDRVAPSTIRADCRSAATGATTECVAGRAFTSAQEVSLVCADATSGCAELEYRLDGGAWTTFSTPFVVSDDGEHPLELRFYDVAGNVATRTVAVEIDGTAPDTPIVTTPEPYTQVDPKWDITVSDTVGTVKEIRLRVNGQDHAVIAPGNPTVRYTYHPTSQGSFCLTARAVDRADNVGPESDPVCVVIDWYEPLVWIESPVDGRTYWNGHPLPFSVNHNVVIGRMDFTSGGRDYGASGIGQHSLSYTYGEGSVPTKTQECGAVANCAIDFDSAKNPMDPKWYTKRHRVDAKVADRAGLSWSDTDYFYAFSLLASGAKTPQDQPYVDLYFAKYTGDKPFVRYDIHRSSYAGASWSRIASITDVETSHFVDWNVTAEVTYIYRVLPYVDWSPSGQGPCCWSDGTSNEYPASAPGSISIGSRRTVDPAVVAASQ